MSLEEYKKTSDYSLLTEDQKKFFEAFFAGKNISLNGAAGTGKSFCIKSLCGFLGFKIPIGITASTGVAALNIGGSTIHSWAGMGLADEDVQSIIKNSVLRNRKAVPRIFGSKVLIIDEVSMLSADFLNKLDIVLKYVRQSNDPFGGIQIVLVSDFLQLPPVFKRANEEKGFAFNSRAWKEANIEVVILKKIMRQDSNSDFVKMLNEIREGKTDSLALLSSRINAKFPDDGIKPIKIYCKNIDVDRFNKSELDRINAPIQTYYARDDGQEHHIKYFDKNCPAPKILDLKVGAQVMLLKNLDVNLGLVNGSIGVITKFTTDGPEVRFSFAPAIIPLDEWCIKEQFIGFDKKLEYRVVATRKQIPLRLAWANTIHKTQGSTLDRVEVDLNEAFACGQAYTALSRVRNLESLSVKEFSPSRVMVNQECLEFYKQYD